MDLRLHAPPSRGDESAGLTNASSCTQRKSICSNGWPARDGETAFQPRATAGTVGTSVLLTGMPPSRLGHVVASAMPESITGAWL